MELIKTINSWLHIITATISLIFGFYVLIAQKGTIRHQQVGRWYFWAMLINCVTSFFILNVFGKWFFPHWLGLVTIVILITTYIISFKKNYRHWLKVHILGFVLSYYLLIGGAINELFVHVESLRPLMLNGSPEFGLTHFASQIIFTILIGYFLWKYRGLRINK